jgi:hypothetical protein
MSWQAFSFHFKQVYEEGYRYLDRCGEFMIQAVNDMDFMPGEIQVTGAKLEKPELGIKAAIDSNELVVTQEQPDDGKDFLRACDDLSKLAANLFQPRRVWSNGFAYKAYWPFGSPEAVLKASLSLGENYEAELAKVFGMVASHKHLDYYFAAGSYEFRVNIQPVTFERVAIARFNPDFRSSPERRRRIERLNKRAERIKTGVAHALMLDLDLIEHEPPTPPDLQKHFDQLLKSKSSAADLFKMS